MITYELAKDAGFPQTGEGKSYLHYGLPYCQLGNDAVREATGCYVPTLSELTEACGIRLNKLERGTFGDEHRWIALSLRSLIKVAQPRTSLYSH
jgi:hypothetical protein